jgi:hypothetical protein
MRAGAAPSRIAAALAGALMLAALATAARADIDPNGDCWVDNMGGPPVSRLQTAPSGARLDPADPNRATRPAVPAGPLYAARPGADFIRKPDGTWADAKTGAIVPSDEVVPQDTWPDWLDPVHATRAAVPAGPNTPARPGADYVRMPCKP